jgi:integrase/recombinase XerD
MIATCRLILYHYQHKKIDNKEKYPIRLRVTFQRQSKYFSLRVSITPPEFKKLLTSPSLKTEFQHLVHFLGKAESIADELKEHFSWEEFEDRFFVKVTKKTGPVYICESIAEYAENARVDGRLKTYASHMTTLSKVKLHNKSKPLLINSVTKEWLTSFAEYLRKEGLKPASIGIYTRNIRTIFNWEISRGRIKQEFYPFGRNKFSPPSSTRVKKALTLDDVIKIFEYIPKTENELWSRDLWLFSYLANGMNMKDVAKLKYENITDNELHFVRAKTQRKTSANQRLINVHLHPHMVEIMNRWGNKDKHPDQFIFQIMQSKLPTPLEEYRWVDQAVKTINKYMKRIGATLGLSKHPTCNFARHTYSTVLKRANVPIEVISESLGHFSVKTTEIYLDSFESDKRAEISRFLFPVKDGQ